MDNKKATAERLITFNDKTQNMAMWAREIGIPYLTLAKRFSRGWPVEKALTQPLGRREKGKWRWQWDGK
jgi:hypothetical protein